MKVAIVLFLLASPALAQNKPTDPPVAPGCGTDDAKFEVTKVKDQHPVPQPEAEKALVYLTATRFCASITSSGRSCGGAKVPWTWFSK
jgi:hypothetical protein